MTCARLPLKVRLPLVLLPALMLAPPARFTVTLPLPTDSCTLARLLSPSATDKPLMARARSSLVLWAPGTLLMGALLVLMWAENADVPANVPPPRLGVAVALMTWPAVTATPLSKLLKVA